MLGDLGRDVRYAFHALLNAPAFSAAVVLTLSIGIGANAIIFGAVDAVLLRDAQVADPDRVVDVYTTSGTSRYGSFSYPDYFDLRDSGTFTSLAAYASIAVTLDATGQTELLAAELVSGNYFDALGIRMARGRGFAPDEDRIETPVRVAIISQTLWQRVFSANPMIIGQTLRLNGGIYTVVGVAPGGFAGPQIGGVTEVWVPTALQPEVDPASPAVRRARGHAGKFDLRNSRGLSVVGRLRNGESVLQAAAHADVIGRRLQAAHPDTNRNRTFTLTRLGEGRGLRTATRPMLRQLTTVVGIVLLIACVNVAGLLLARAASRGRETAVRVAIGASRAALVRQWLVESVLLALFGSLGALVVASSGMPLLHAFVIPEAIALSLNPRILAFTLAIAVASGLLFGMAPVIHAIRRDPIGALRDEGGVVATGVRAARVRGAFVILQVALSLVLLIAAGLFLRTLANAYAVDIPYQVDHTLVASLNLEVRGYSPETGNAVYERIMSAVDALPGVVATGAARMTVLSGSARLTSVSADGRPLQRDNSNALGVRANVVSPRYFEVMNISIVRGRSFAPSDRPGTTRVAVVSQSLADRLWPGADPIGKALPDEGNRVQLVVGVAADAIYTSPLERDAWPTFYLPLAQNYESAVALHVRADGEPRLLVRAIREAVRQVDSRLVLERPQLLRGVLDRTLNQQRMMAALIGVFAGVALLLAAVGLYGLMAYVATQRRAEIGIRVAIGAQQRCILALIMGQGLRLLAVGLAIGVAGAVVTTRLIAAQLFGVDANDPLTFAVGCGVLASAGLIACALPAWRAARVDPLLALRRG